MATSFLTQDIIDRVIQNLRSKSEWANLLNTSTNVKLIEAFAEELNYCIYYDEYLTRESKWTLAQNKSSLLSFQDVLRYKASRKISSVGVLRLSLSDLYFEAQDWVSTTAYILNDEVSYNGRFYRALGSTTGDIPSSSPSDWIRIDVAPTTYSIDIPKYTIFTTEAGLKFTTLESNSLTTSNDYIDINIIQGIPKSETFIAQGLENEELTVNNTNIENTYNLLTVNSIEWTKTNDLQLNASTDEVYEIEDKLDLSGIYIKFGDNVTGEKLEVGDSVIYEYIETTGNGGDISSSGYINTIDSTIYDSNGDEVDLKCYNQFAVLGGQDYESIESIRANAPITYQTGDRATSKADYEAIIERFNFVKKATVWGAYEVNLDNGDDPWTFIPSEENKVHVAAINTSDTTIDNSQKLLISEGINEYKAPTDIVTYDDVEFVNLIFNVNAYISNKSYTLSTVNSNIRNALSEAYSIDALEFFQFIRFSDYQRLIDEVAGVEYHDTTVKLYKNHTFNVTWQFDIALPVYPIVSESINVYVKDIVEDEDEFLIATTDGSGNFVGETGYESITGGVNYPTGIGAFSLEDTLPEAYTNYRIRLEYVLNSNNLFLKKRSQIFKYDDSLSVVDSSYL